MSKEDESEFDVLSHAYVPKHEIVPSSEVDEVTSKYNATPAQFPYILRSDPVVKAIGAKPGNLIKITRKSATAGETVYYRFVVEE